VYNKYITAEVLLPKGDEFRVGTVVKTKADGNGKALGKSNPNPLLDTREYEVKVGDGEVLEYAENVIAENLYSSVDKNGQRFVKVDSIIDHKKSKQAMLKTSAFIEMK
jgi:hypothetical protein